MSLAEPPNFIVIGTSEGLHPEGHFRNTLWLRTEMVRLLEEPEKKRVSELERLRLGPMRVSGKAMEPALDRAREVRDLRAGAVDAGRVPAARTTGPVRYGLTSKAPSKLALPSFRPSNGPWI
ncbi:hypothetical protein H7827_03975 [Streptomyces sp. JH002]|uniref:hypothetical protein n=1 Tax=Streptomyces sp. JH002 TaxID=2763259 RepID=UPI003D801B30